MSKIGLLVGTMVAALATPVTADELAMSVNVSAFHFDRSKPFNENNYGVGIEYGDTVSTRWNVGYYRNSFNRHSNYAFASKYARVTDGLEIGGFVGGVTGYRIAAVIPALGLVGSLKYQSFTTNIYVIPPVTYHQKKMDGFVALQLAFPFNE